MTFRDITQQIELRKAQEQNKMTDMLVSSVTHEYLTPVRCIYNLTNILLTRVDDEENKKNVKMIQNTSMLLLA